MLGTLAAMAAQVRMLPLLTVEVVAVLLDILA
jgi:hypothetical protein